MRAVDTNRDYTSLAISDACPTTTTTDSGSDASLDTSGSPITLTGGPPYDLNSTYGHICVDDSCMGGNHFQGDVQVFAKYGQICVIPPSGYEVVGDTCQNAGGRKDFVIQHIGGTNGPANGAAVVADGTRFLCAADENPQSAAAPIGYSLVGSRVDLTTDTGLPRPAAGAGATFDSALTVCLSHTNADILKAGGAAASLRVVFFDGVMWQPLPVTSANANETCGLADHFAQFGLMAATPTALSATGAVVAPVV